jgi:hypothetical protein
VLTAFANAFRTPDLRRKMLFVLMIIAIFRAGCQIPAPGVDVGNVQSCINDVDNTGIYNLTPEPNTVRKDRLQLFLDSVIVKCSAWPLGSGYCEVAH